MQVTVSILSVSLSAVLTAITYAYLRASRAMADATAESAKAASSSAESANAQVSAVLQSVVEMREQRMAMARPFLVLAASPKRIITSDFRARVTVQLENVGLGPAVAPRALLRSQWGSWKSSRVSIKAIVVGAVWECEFLAPDADRNVRNEADGSVSHAFHLSTEVADIYGRRICIEQDFEITGEEPVARVVDAPYVSSVAIKRHDA